MIVFVCFFVCNFDINMRDLQLQFTYPLSQSVYAQIGIAQQYVTSQNQNKNKQTNKQRTTTTTITTTTNNKNMFQYFLLGL